MDDIFTNATVERVEKNGAMFAVGIIFYGSVNALVEEIKEVRDGHFLVTFKDSEVFLVVNNPDYITYKKGKK